MDVPNVVDPTSTEAAAAANTSDLDSPVRVLVQTQTHLVPGDRSTEFGERYDAMVNLICQHVWQREYDKFRERVWNYHCHFALDNVECWFLVDHHGPDPSPPPDPPIVWYRWTGTEFVMMRDPLPGRVRRELRHYPFQRVAYHVLIQEYPKRRTPRVYKSRAEEIRVKRKMLRDTLLSSLGLTEELLRFVQDCPDAAEWVKARVPPETWARLEDPSEIVLPLEPKEGHTWTGPTKLEELS
ncbi:hypothetical protein C8A03DRAFT_46963 [Achaetomium macrosporum]|uniref:Uncharacterized protein n=1 Tax=Achaetomium macrosporum TaxID=79813 RepID=A0AAN7C3N0_9PEZI|nr:hypothetical protein C8A03DRAFT_46963 [Achaetomium macrosporum]